MYDKGFIYLHRKLLRNPIVCKDADYLAVWTWLLLNVVWDSAEVMFGGKKITLKAGQITTGRRVIASALKISESKVQRILKAFENEHQIEQRTDRQCRLITIVSWDEYQLSEQRNEHQMNNERTTSEQRVNTNKERNKEIKKESNKRGGRFTPPTIEEVSQYITEQNFRVNAERFIDYYEANGWLVGKNKMKDWKATIRNWERRETENRGTTSSKSSNPFTEMLKKGDYL